MSATFQILVAVSSDRVFKQFEPLMSRSDLRVIRVRSGQQALTLAQGVNFDLVVCQHPFGDIGFEEFHSRLRAAGGASNESPALVVTRDDRKDELVESLEADDSRLFCVDLQPENMSRSLTELIGVAVRASSRLLVETHVDCDGSSADRVFQTANISESGLLLRSQRPLPIGFRTEFSLSLPESENPIRGIAEVVRHTDPDCELCQGMGVRLLRIEDNGRQRLAQFIRLHLSNGEVITPSGNTV